MDAMAFDVAHTLTGTRQGSPGDMQTRRCFEVCCACCASRYIPMAHERTLSHRFTDARSLARCLARGLQTGIIAMC